MFRPKTPLTVALLLALLALLAPLAHAGKIEANVTLSSYWVSNYKYYHSNTYVNLTGMTGTAWPDTPFRGKFRSDFVGPMTVTVDWQRVTKRQLMSVRGHIDPRHGKQVEVDVPLGGSPGSSDVQVPPAERKIRRFTRIQHIGSGGFQQPPQPSPRLALAV